MKNVFVAPVGFYGACRCIVGLCGGWWFVGAVGLWGVSIMRVGGKDKANPLKKHKKNLTRVLKKPILAVRGSEKFL